MTTLEKGHFPNALLRAYLTLFFFIFLPVAIAYDFKDQEFFGLAKSVHEIRQRHDPGEYVYVGIGRSPAPMIAYHQEYGDDAFNLPMTWSSSRYETQMKEIRSKLNLAKDEDFSMDLAQVEGLPFFSARDKMKLKDHFNRFLVPAIEKALKTGKKLLLMDFVSTGLGLFLTNLYMNDYLKRTGLEGKLKVEYLGIGMGDKSELHYKSPQWHTYEVGGTETRDYHASLVLKSFKDFAEYDSFVVDDDINHSASLRPNPKYKQLQSSLHARHPKFIQQISYKNERRQLHQLKDFADLIKGKLLDGSCLPEKTLVVFDIDSVLTVDELDDSYPFTHEADTAKVVKRIQEMGASAMALTNRAAIKVMKSRKNALIPHFAHTFSDLHGLGINFRKSSSLIESGLEANGNLLRRKELGGEGAFFDGKKSIYFKGIYSIDHDYRGKGNRLEDLLKKAGLDGHYQCLFFVDDTEANNLSVEEQFRYKMNVFSAHLKAPAFKVEELFEEVDGILPFGGGKGQKNECRIEFIE